MKAVATPLKKTGDTLALIQAATAGLVGLLVVPLLLGPEGPGSTYAVGNLDPRLALWLAVAFLIAIWLLILAPAMAQATARLLARALPDDPSLLDASSRFLPTLARWLVALGYVVLASAIVRAPMVSVLSSYLDLLAVESAVASVAVLLLILVLVRLHGAAAPAVETYTWHALDALVSTTGPLPVGRAGSYVRTRTASSDRSEVKRRVTSSAQTAPPSPTVPPDGEATDGTAGVSGPALPDAVGMTVSDRMPDGAESPARTVGAPVATQIDGLTSPGEEQTQPEVANTVPDEPRPNPAAA